MRTNEIDAALAAANPVAPAALASLRFDDAGVLLLDAIRAEARPVAATRRATRSPRRKAPRRVWLLSGVGVAAAAVALLLVLSGGGGTAGQTPAYGAELIRYAEKSPLLLLELPEWHVIYANEEASGEGEMHFAPTGVSESEALKTAELHWRNGSFSGWSADRAASSDFSTTDTVLGTTARVYRYVGGQAGQRTFTALWTYRGRVLEFRGTVPDLAHFESMLAALHRANDTEWLSAMPQSVISAASHPATVQAMLRGIPLPPGFDASRISENGLTQDRYQLGAEVSGTVACMWFERWAQARQSGNQAELQQAIAAMATAHNWPVLREMESRGAYPQVVDEYAADMQSGSWYGRPLATAVSSGLGCPSKGIQLAPRGSEGSTAPQQLP